MGGYSWSLTPGIENVLLMKWDLNGTLTWTRTWGYGSGSNEATGIWADNASIYMCGYTLDYGTSYEQLVIKWNKLYTPDITYEGDVEIIHGTTGHTLNWTLIDPEILNATYELFINGQLNQTGSWVSGTVIVLSTDGLANGVYNYTLIAQDGYGNSIQVSAIIIVANTFFVIPWNTIIIVTIIIGIVVFLLILQHKMNIKMRKEQETTGIKHLLSKEQILEQNKHDQDRLLYFKDLFKDRSEIRQNELAQIWRISKKALFEDLVRWHNVLPFKINVKSIQVDDFEKFSNAIDKYLAEFPINSNKSYES